LLSVWIIGFVVCVVAAFPLVGGVVVAVGIVLVTSPSWQGFAGYAVIVVVEVVRVARLALQFLLGVLLEIEVRAIEVLRFGRCRR
jgi:hypothetical protein